MDSLADLLGGLDHSEPPEIAAIKQYVQTHFKTVPLVALQPQAILITVPSASMAGALRMHILQMQQAAVTDKRLIIRIGRSESLQ